MVSMVKKKVIRGRRLKLPKPSLIVFPDNVQPPASPVQSSAQDTVKSTTPPSCTSRPELSRTRCGRRVTLPSRLADYAQ
ncbi:unnamed protein product [Hymenolepis diminuta]|uniref:Uncharacterized protein n=1 Tax=Hymenolepis diminuta TaxID=6216 RepID=A0A0R3SGW1_HYMDI|nr:unnamed protein product [Hymenolepis diminuta]